MAEQLLAALDPDEVLGLVHGDLEEAWEQDHVFETGAAWEPLHRCLNGGAFDVVPDAPVLSLVFLGGQPLVEDDEFIGFVSAAEVSRVATALAQVTFDWLREQYFALEYEDLRRPTEQGFATAWAAFEGLPGFFARAAREGRAVVFTV
jgi:hypothetical protein